MDFVNGRIIINENEIDTAEKEIKRIFNKALKELGYNKRCNVDVEMECWNSENNYMWNEIIIRSGDFNIQFTTDGVTPSLVYTDKFEFFYVFDYGASGCTNPETFINISRSPLKDGQRYVEDMVLKMIFKR